MSELENWGLLGHEHAVQLLREHICRERVRHAYLFTGPPGVGRRTLARRFAMALNCTNPPAPGEPCGRCRACIQIEAMQHPDLQVVQAEKVGGVLKVEQVREMQRSLSLFPYEARYRVVLLLHFEDAHISAVNALLKTLEEPEPHVILLLTAAAAEQLLPTIVSRCVTLRLRPVPAADLADGLKKRLDLDGSRAELIAHLAEGRPGYAIRLDADAQLLEVRRTAIDDLIRLLSQGRIDRFVYAESLAKDKEKSRFVLAVWLSFWRDVLLQAGEASANLTNIGQRQAVEDLADRIGLEGAHRALCLVEQTLGYLDRNVNSRLALEGLMLDLPKG